MYKKLSVKDRLQYMKDYKLVNPNGTYDDMIKSFAEGGEVDIKPTTVSGYTTNAQTSPVATYKFDLTTPQQVTQAKPNLNLSKETIQKYSQPETKEQYTERRRGVIKEYPHAYNVEDYKLGISEPGLEESMSPIDLLGPAEIKAAGNFIGRGIKGGLSGVKGIGKAGILPNPLKIIDNIVPNPDPISMLTLEASFNNTSPLNMLPFYGKYLDKKGLAFRKFGNSIDEVIENQRLSPSDGGMRIGGKQISKEGNWAAMNNPHEGYNGVFEATFDKSVPGSNLNFTSIGKRNGILVTDKNLENLSSIPITEPGMSFNRRLPFSSRYIPIDKEKLINKEFQFSTMLPHTQSLLEKYTKGLSIAGAAGATGLPNAIETYNKYTGVTNLKKWSKEQYDDFKKYLENQNKDSKIENE